MSRKVKNERYYLSEIHKHSEKILKELKRLKVEINDLKSSAILKEKAVNHLNQLETEKNDLETQTQKYRFILNVLNNKTRLDNVAEETNEKSAENKDLLIRLEDIYVSRKNRERNIEELKTAIQQENILLERELEKLNEGEKQEYYRKQETLQTIKNEIVLKENSLVENNTKADFYLNKIDNPVKKSLFNLISEYEVLREERDKLSDLIRNKGSIKYEEDNLLQAIRDARVQVQNLELENKSYQQKLDSAQEIMDGLDKDLKEGYSARHGKFLELMKREQKMNQFIESAVEKIENYKQLTDSAGDAIVEGLNFWSLHLGEMDENEFDTDDIVTAKQEYQMQTTRLQNMKDRISNVKNEIEDLRNKKTELEKQLLEQDDPDEAREAIQIAIQANIEEQEVLKKKVAATVSAIEVAFKSNKELTEKLARNKSYGELRILEENLNDFEKRKTEYLGRISILENYDNTEKSAQDTFDLIKAYNKLLTAK